MTFHTLADYFSKLEKTSLRNEMTQILSDLFKKSEETEIGKLCYLLQGRVAPLFEAIEFGIADKMMLKAVAMGLSIEVEKVGKLFKAVGDLGKTVERIKNEELGIRNKNKITILEVYDILYEVAISAGEGSQDRKSKLLGDLIAKVDPLSANYIVRITLAKLRLGFSDMTMLDALSWMLTGNKDNRALIEKAYNVQPDLGYIASSVKKDGVRGLSHVKPKVGTPILMAKAERLGTCAEIIEKIGECSVEPKFDGFRVQVHYNKSKISRRSGIHDAVVAHFSQTASGQNSKYINHIEPLSLFGDEPQKFVRLFSRNLEDVTRMYPDIVEGVIKQIDAKEAILEGEAIAYNPDTNEYLPFQETVQRKRKYDIAAKAKEIPLRLISFELLYKDGESFIHTPYQQRRKILHQTIKKGDTVLISEAHTTHDPKEMEKIFLQSVSAGLEGIMAKKIDGIYRAGARDWNWIKLKRSYESKLNDTIDLVVMGIDMGQGKRTGFGIGDFLAGVYDAKRDVFVTMAKIGTGLTDEEWKTLKVQSSKFKVQNKPNNYDVDKMMECDTWITPHIVVEIRADEITRSPVHTAGRTLKTSKSGNAQDVDVAGFALRFPRLEKFRTDKGPKDITTVSEIEKMYKQQEKK
jgi:DNA ligase 1